MEEEGEREKLRRRRRRILRERREKSGRSGSGTDDSSNGKLEPKEQDKLMTQVAKATSQQLRSDMLKDQKDFAKSWKKKHQRRSSMHKIENFFRTKTQTAPNAPPSASVNYPDLGEYRSARDFEEDGDVRGEEEDREDPARRMK